jgi:hypothetical protein
MRLSKKNDGNKLDEWVADTSAIGDLIIIVATTRDADANLLEMRP